MFEFLARRKAGFSFVILFIFTQETVRHIFSKRVFFVTFLAIVASVVIYFWQVNKIELPVIERVFVVSEKDNVHTIAERLKEDGLVSHRTFFYLAYYAYAPRNTFKPGGHQLSTAMSLREMVYVLQGEPWAKYVTIPEGATKEKIAEILGTALGWEELDVQFFANTYAGMQWQRYEEVVQNAFKERYAWTDSKKETFLTLSSFYYDNLYDFFKNAYVPGTYEIPVSVSRAQAAGILIDRFAKENADHEDTAMRAVLDTEAMDAVAKLIEEEMVLMPDIVAIPAEDLTLMEKDGRTLLAFSTSYWNRGRGPLELVADPRTKNVGGDTERKVYQRLYHLDGDYEERLSGTFLWHQTHLHYHFADFATYTLEALEAENSDYNGFISLKSTFCVRDSEPIDLAHPGAQKSASYKGCGKERQGISPGWADSYYYTYKDQQFDVTNAPAGQYRLTITINPEDRFQEITKDNNVGEVVLYLDVKNHKVEVLEEKQYGIR